MTALALVISACGGNGGGDDNDSAASAVESSTTTANPTTTTTAPEPEGVVREVTDAEGWSYSLNFVPLDPDPAASLGGCVDGPPPGQTNLRMRLIVENLVDDRDAPWPEIVTALNLTADGTATTAAANVENSDFSSIEISPYGVGKACILASGITDYQTDPSAPALVVPAGGTTEFTIVAGPVSDPPPDGTTLLVRYFRQVGDGLDFEVPALPD